MHRYFISYTYRDKTDLGYGNATVDLNWPINDIEATKAIEENIRSKGGYSGVVILHITRLPI